MLFLQRAKTRGQILVLHVRWYQLWKANEDGAVPRGSGSIRALQDPAYRNTQTR